MKYNIVMFAYNEQNNIAKSITSVFENTDDNLARFYLLANGCSDDTVKVAEQTKRNLGFEKLHVNEISLGDKCNAWNTYVHELSDLSDNTGTHFFIDADVRFSANCFAKMHQKLSESPSNTVVVAGVPLSGRNVEFYRSLVFENALFFGNLYGMRHSFIQDIKAKRFRLPIGLNWIDSYLTKSVNTELRFDKNKIANRTTWVEECGYLFDSLSIFKVDDIKLYVSRIARYELGKMQEVILDDTPVEQWPEDMHDINLTLSKEFDMRAKHLGLIKKYMVKRRLERLIAKRKVKT